MADEISLGKVRTVLLVILMGLLIVFFLKVLSIKISFWILAVVIIVAILFIALSYRLKSSASSTTEQPTTTETATTEPTERKRGIIPSLRYGGPGEFWVLGPIFLALAIYFVYLLIQIFL